MSHDEEEPESGFHGVGVAAQGLGPMSGTDYARLLRRRLRAGREERFPGPQSESRAQVAALIQERVRDQRERAGTHKGEKPFTLTPSTLISYENFNRHPAIDVMAAWARVVGLRLIVDLDATNSDRLPVLLPPRAAHVARLLGVLSDKDLDHVEYMIERIAGGERRT